MYTHSTLSGPLTNASQSEIRSEILTSSFATSLLRGQIERFRFHFRSRHEQHFILSPLRYALHSPYVTPRLPIPDPDVLVLPPFITHSFHPSTHIDPLHPSRITSTTSIKLFIQDGTSPKEDVPPRIDQCHSQSVPRVQKRALDR